ncbi:hypothetical protein [Listeria booriae]|uniref:hypothetical protein n=1 Tax=Listeria booriae TaxID=1552123 RepID=UPI0016265232|nr:hypothetical protein [Listeria booriae]MBC1228584.1 hypothetical protein [Listeria booriae]MBC1248087.1 hypothetical protein [Listeria booriae]
MKIKSIVDEKKYKESRKQFIWELVFKLIPCSIITMIITWKVATMEPVMDLYTIIAFILLGVVVVFYVQLLLNFILNWIIISRKKRDLFL